MCITLKDQVTMSTEEIMALTRGERVSVIVDSDII